MAYFDLAIGCSYNDSNGHSLFHSNGGLLLSLSFIEERLPFLHSIVEKGIN